ncbi:hypothetical protein LAZ67_16001654 [Cordylochernes scorpioides]|uniref:Ig-like domain-containing protein n=1 Tax=Cordylochernes scorpioides TaxID=51811 RepID=A0ABY6LEZ5_9ARAC|nr:hypothetical protein LAZ67_16001654 [Cordylochernes scorpioides]
MTYLKISNVECLPCGQVAWIKIDTQTLLAIHTHAITRDSRIRVSHSNNRQWYLHISNVQVEDQGYYMCQINTEPMVSQLGFIEVMVPPRILENLTSSDTTVEERARVSMRCRADGYPTPTISWRREDSRQIHVTTPAGDVQTAMCAVSRVEGDYLNMSQVMREDMGAYLCIASNGIPPSVSKRILLQVNFKPKIRVPSQLVSAPVGHDAELECRLEASPRPLMSWVRNDGLILLNSAKYRITEVDEDWYRITTRVRISRLEEPDFGPYKCVAKNTFGEKEGYVRLYGRPCLPTVLWYM